MAKGTAVKTVQPQKQKKSAQSSLNKPEAAGKELHDKSGEELVIDNLATLSRLVETLGETLELLVQKAENMAYHIIAVEEVLAEQVASNGLDLPMVNARIRAKIAVGTDSLGDPTKAIDIAASIASPLRRR